MFKSGRYFGGGNYFEKDQVWAAEQTCLMPGADCQRLWTREFGNIIEYNRRRLPAFILASQDFCDLLARILMRGDLSRPLRIRLSAKKSGDAVGMIEEIMEERGSTRQASKGNSVAATCYMIIAWGHVKPNNALGRKE